MTDALDDSSSSGLSFREEILAMPRSPHLDAPGVLSASAAGGPAAVMSPAAGCSDLPPPPALADPASDDAGAALLDLYRTHRDALDAFLKEEGNIFAQGPLGAAAGWQRHEKGRVRRPCLERDVLPQLARAGAFHAASVSPSRSWVPARPSGPRQRCRIDPSPAAAAFRAALAILTPVHQHKTAHSLVWMGRSRGVPAARRPGAARASPGRSRALSHITVQDSL